MPNKIVCHDVDLLMPPEIVDVYYGAAEHDIVHMGHLIKDYYAYANFLGGIIAFSSKAFETINGFPNHMYGWGGEDDALHGRIFANKLKVCRPDERKTGVEIKLSTEKETQKIPSMIDAFKKEDLLLDEQIWRMNGLNTLQYKLVNHQRLSNTVYKITVEL